MRSDNWLVTLLRTSLLSLLLLARLLEFNGLVDHEYNMLLLDLNLSSFQHGEQLRRGLRHPLHVVVQHKAFVARGQRLQHPINSKFIRNLTFQSIQALNVPRDFDHELTNCDAPDLRSCTNHTRNVHDRHQGVTVRITHHNSINKIIKALYYKPGATRTRIQTARDTQN